MATHRIMTPDGKKADGVIVKKAVAKTSEQKIRQKIREELKAKADAKPKAKKLPGKKKK